MAFGGKNSNIDGFMPYTFSDDDGASFAKGAKLPFPALGGNQRPCAHRLLSGNLVFVPSIDPRYIIVEILWPLERIDCD